MKSLGTAARQSLKEENECITGDKKQLKDIQGQEMCVDGRICPAGEVTGLGQRQRRSYWGHEDRLRMEQGALRGPQEGQLGACMEGTLSVRQGDTGGREGLGHNHGRDAQSSGETLGLRHQVFEHQH